MKKFHKCKCENSWESLTYSIDGKKLSHNDVLLVEVQFPDGSEKELEVIWKQHHASYSDHGHVSFVTTHKAFVEVSVMGLKQLLDLKDLNVRILEQTDIDQWWKSLDSEKKFNIRKLSMTF